MKKLFVISLVIVLLDQLTKFFFIDINLKIFSFLSLNYVENTGAAFGILQNQVIFLSIISAGVLALIIYYWKTLDNQEKLALSFIFAGTLGNLIDRIFRGFVIDFIDFGFWPAFNIADASNVVGVLLLIYFYILNKSPIK